MSNSIRSIVEDRIQAFLVESGELSHPILRGQDSTEKQGSAVIIYAPSADAQDLGVSHLGNFRVSLEVHIFTNFYDNTLEGHRSQADIVESLLQESDILSDFWGAEYGTLYNISLQNIDEGKDDDKWGNLLRFEVHCCLPEA